jgi:hypothetical protein
MAVRSLASVCPKNGKDWTSLPQYQNYARELHDRPIPCCPRCAANPRRGDPMVVGMAYVACGTCQKLFNR